MGKKRKLQIEAWSSDEEYATRNSFDTNLNSKSNRRNRKLNNPAPPKSWYEQSSESDDDGFEYMFKIKPSAQNGINFDKLPVNDQATKKLRGEIEAFAKYIAPAAVELEVRQELFKQIENIILSMYPHAQVALYGSSTSSMSTFRSDLDITLGNLENPIELTGEQDQDVNHKYVLDEEEGDNTETSFSLNLDFSSIDATIATPAVDVPLKKKQKKVYISPWNPTHRRKKIRILSSIYTLLKSKMPTLKLKLLTKAKIPIIMCEDTISSVSIDIGLHRETYEECDHGQTTALVDTIRQRFDGFYTVVLFLKELLNQYDLDKTYAGGIGSFRLYIMVASIYLKHHATKKKTSCTVEILLTFFQVYGDPSFLYGSKNLSLPAPYECIVDFEAVFRLEECCALFQEVSDNMKRHIRLEDGHQSLRSELYAYFYSYSTRSARERSRNDAIKAMKRLRTIHRQEWQEAQAEANATLKSHKGSTKKRKKKQLQAMKSSASKP